MKVKIFFIFDKEKNVNLKNNSKFLEKNDEELQKGRSLKIFLRLLRKTLSQRKWKIIISRKERLFYI
jgi:hypothetical protein